MCRCPARERASKAPLAILPNLMDWGLPNTDSRPTATGLLADSELSNYGFVTLGIVLLKVVE
jgi:hypothetical protein